MVIEHYHISPFVTSGIVATRPSTVDSEFEDALNAAFPPCPAGVGDRMPYLLGKTSRSLRSDPGQSFATCKEKMHKKAI